MSGTCERGATVVAERDITLADGRTLYLYDTGGADRLPVLWHHGTANIGAPPEPLFVVADRLGLRWFAFDRPTTAAPARCPAVPSDPAPPTP
jgi:hypothetical protein